MEPRFGRCTNVTCLSQSTGSFTLMIDEPLRVTGITSCTPQLIDGQINGVNASTDSFARVNFAGRPVLEVQTETGSLELLPGRRPVAGRRTGRRCATSPKSRLGAACAGNPASVNRLGLRTPLVASTHGQGWLSPKSAPGPVIGAPLRLARYRSHHPLIRRPR